jgi:hypothetical protein
MGDNKLNKDRDRRSLETCPFAQQWRAHLKALYKEYQKRQLCVYGAKTQFESAQRRACVQTLLDSSLAVHSKNDHKAFKEAVNAELKSDGTPR